MTSMDAIFAYPCSILYLLPYTGQSQLASKKQKILEVGIMAFLASIF